MSYVALRALPSVDRLLSSAEGQVLIAEFGHLATRDAARYVLEAARLAVQAGGQVEGTPASIAGRVAALLAEAAKPGLRRVFNLTGTVLHTNLGRAILPEEAVEAAMAAMRHPVTLEYALEGGVRGERDDPVRALICELTGAEDACLVNNNAAAVLLVLASLSAGKETIVSRGELIEIGGAFRLPEIMKRAGANLHEVGTTNRTHQRDFEEAINEKTGLIMKAHTSNYAITGFTAEVAPPVLAALAREKSVPFVDDLGSGTLIDLSHYGLPRERTVQDALRDGADLVTFSGDKLLGGPQCGFIVGRRDLVRLCAKNHLKRSLRLDKIRLAALEATLKLYRNPDTLAARLPTLRFFARKREEIAAQAARLLPAFATALGAEWAVQVMDCASQIGSGALPLETMPSAALAAAPRAERKGTALDILAKRLRALSIPVIGRIHDDTYLLDLRCLEDEPAFLAQLAELS
jgi:L-seryl-tRNA(Ser) seleniumtransferase